METRIIELPDGRELCFSENGDPEGTPVLAFHGTPGSRGHLLYPAADSIAKSLGVRLIAPDRPGYGHSTFQPGRRLTDWPYDVAAVADHLGVDRFAVIGHSGGGPHALVCAATLHDRVARAAIVGGIGPMVNPEVAEAMMRSNRIVFSLARRSERVVRPMTALTGYVVSHYPDRAVAFMMKQLPASDVEVLRRPEVMEIFTTDARRTSATAPRAAAQDMSLFANPWDFDLSQIAVPVDFWQGRDDRTVPPSHAKLQADQIPHSSLHELAGEGHFLLYNHLEDILRAVKN
jgi:pimeloyl-ACP methyl ester carboxylesterase